MCGSDGCGSTCGQCYGNQQCTSTSAGTQQCTMPTTTTVAGFFDGGSDYRIRFAPPYAGTWRYVTHSNVDALNNHTGTVTVAPASRGNHGPVHSQGYAFVHADGTPHFSVGTTSYQWSSKDFDMQEETLETLLRGPDGAGPVFSKIRMTVFPKWYDYNHANPVQTGAPYDILPSSPAANATNWHCVGSDCAALSGSFDLQRFNVSYWHNYDRLLRRLQGMSVVADVIVFHPYDGGHWGFDCMGGRDPRTYNTTHDDFYLKYLAARISSFSNVWWAMANEWSFCKCKSRGVTGDNGPSPIWDALFRTLSTADVYRRQMSIHNGDVLYNHSQPWITHVSLQGHETDTPTLRPKYQKPVVWDEERYEGNVTSSWGQLSGAEMADRFWWGMSMGAYVGHSEALLRANVASDDAQPLWWAKGGILTGTSPARIRWFRSLFADNNTMTVPPMSALSPHVEMCGTNAVVATVVMTTPSADASRFALVHMVQAGSWAVPIPHPPCPIGGAAAPWTVVAVDYWGMRSAPVGTLPCNATIVTLDAPAVPANFILVNSPA
eukprot:m.170086 g.170086  ORF g.170086 m.170086 type:complete len:549 (-) comp18258_c0_seq1:254-1900(-)